MAALLRFDGLDMRFCPFGMPLYSYVFEVPTITPVMTENSPVSVVQEDDVHTMRFSFNPTCIQKPDTLMAEKNTVFEWRPSLCTAEMEFPADAITAALYPNYIEDFYRTCHAVLASTCANYFYVVHPVVTEGGSSLSLLVFLAKELRRNGDSPTPTHDIIMRIAMCGEETPSVTDTIPFDLATLVDSVKRLQLGPTVRVVSFSNAADLQEVWEELVVHTPYIIPDELMESPEYCKWLGEVGFLETVRRWPLDEEGYPQEKVWHLPFWPMGTMDERMEHHMQKTQAELELALHNEYTASLIMHDLAVSPEPLPEGYLSCESARGPQTFVAEMMPSSASGEDVPRIVPVFQTEGSDPLIRAYTESDDEFAGDVSVSDTDDNHTMGAAAMDMDMEAYDVSDDELTEIMDRSPKYVKNAPPRVLLPSRAAVRESRVGEHTATYVPVGNMLLRVLDTVY